MEEENDVEEVNNAAGKIAQLVDAFGRLAAVGYIAADPLAQLAKSVEFPNKSPKFYTLLDLTLCAYF